MMWPDQAKGRFIALAVVLCAACQPVHGCVDGRFELAPDSRLPRWFTLPSADRKDIQVELLYRSSPGSGLRVVFVMQGLDGRPIDRATGGMCWHPATHWTPNPDGAFVPVPYPHYVIVSVRGVVEVIEHVGLRNLFAVSDAGPVVEEALAAIERGECRHLPDVRGADR
jgi:hypothetical protein